jgi:hypothetical protein
MRHFPMADLRTSKIIADPYALFRDIVQGELQEYLPLPGHVPHTTGNHPCHPTSGPARVLQLLDGLRDFGVCRLIHDTKEPCQFEVLPEHTANLLPKCWGCRLPKQLWHSQWEE